jgi:hypothetical protein
LSRRSGLLSRLRARFAMRGQPADMRLEVGGEGGWHAQEHVVDHAHEAIGAALAQGGDRRFGIGPLLDPVGSRRRRQEIARIVDQDRVLEGRAGDFGELAQQRTLIEFARCRRLVGAAPMRIEPK